MCSHSHGSYAHTYDCLYEHQSTWAHVQRSLYVPAHASVMEKTATSRNSAGDIFSIDVVATVLSRRAVDILARACPPRGIHCCNQANAATEDPCTGHPVVPLVCGNLSRRSPSLECFSGASSAHGRPDCASRYTGSRDGATSKYISPSPTTRRVSEATRSCSGLPRCTATPADASQSFVWCNETTSCANSEHGSETRTQRERRSAGSLPSPGGGLLEGCVNDFRIRMVSREAHTGEYTSVFQPSADYLERGQCDRRRRTYASSHAFREERTTGAGEAVASPAAVSCFRPAYTQRNDTDTEEILEEWEENNTRDGSRRKNSAAGSIHTSICSDQPRSACRASEKDAKSYTAVAQGKNEGEDSQTEVGWVLPPLEQVHNFLAAALRTARSSLYVCLPIRATEALSLGCTYGRPSTVTSVPERASDGTTGSQDREAANSEFPLQASATDFVVHWNDVLRGQWTGSTAKAVCTCIPLSSQHTNGNNSSAALPPRGLSSKTAPMADSVVAAPGTASADAVATAPRTATASSHTSQAASAPTYAAALASVTVSSRAAAPHAASNWHDSDQAPAKRTSLTATGHANGFCCMYAQLDSHQIVVTPTCCVFRIIYHLYTFLTSCAAAFAPFAADVYIVPVWVDAETGDGRASYGGAAASNTTARGSETAPGKTAVAGASASPAGPAAAKSEFAAGERSRTAGEEGAAEEAVFGCATGASGESAPTSSEAPRTAVGTPLGEGDNFCEWQCRLLRALQSHCRSCRGLRMTEGKIVNLVDSAFEIADRSFAEFSSATEELATYSYARETGTTNVSHLQSFSEVLSTLMIPAAARSVPARCSRGEPSGVEAHAGERDKTAAVKGASVCAAKATAEPEDEPHQQAQATVDHAAEAKRSGTASAKPAAAAAKAVACKTTDADVAEDAAESEEAASEDTAEDGVAPVAERRCELNDLPRAGAVCQFRHVIVAGTFDRLHAGHKLMLTVAVLLTSERLGIGITSGALVQKKAGGDAAQAAAAVQTFAVRAHTAAAFVTLIASAAQAAAPLAAILNRAKSASAASIPAAASVPEECVSTTPGDDAAVAEAAEFGDICSLATAVVPEDGGICKEGISAEEVGCAERAHLAPKDNRGSAHAVPAASTADEAVARREKALRTLRAHAEGHSGEAAALSRKTNSLPVHFVNYFQAVLRDEVGKRAGRQNGSSTRCACMRRVDADVNPQKHSPRVSTQDEGRARVTPEGAAARGAKERFLRAEAGKRETARGLVCDMGFEGGDAAENYTGSEIENEAKHQATRAERKDDRGIRTRDTAAAAEVSNLTDAAVGVQEQTAWEESRATTGVSLRPSEKRLEQQGLAAEGDDEVLDTEEHLEEGIVDTETHEKQWARLVLKGLAETETIEAEPDAQPNSNTSRINGTLVTPSLDSTCISFDDGFPHPKYDRIFLPWTSSVVPPNFFSRDTSLLACKKRLGSVIPRDIRAGAVEDTASEHAGPGEPMCAPSAAAVARPTPVASASAARTASPESPAVSTWSPPAYPSSTASSSSSGRAASCVLSSSPVPTFPVYAAAGGAWAAVADLGSEHCTTGTPLSRATAFARHGDPPCVALIWSKCSRTPVSVHLMPIEDRLGPAGDLAFDALVVSSESLAGGFYVNEERIKRSQPPVCLVEVPAVLTFNQQVVAQARAASVSEKQATHPLRGPIRLPVIESASCFLPSGSSLLHFGRAPEPPRSSVTSLPEERPGAPGCDLGIPHVNRNHEATHACASADSERGRRSTTSSPVYKETVKEQRPATSSLVLSDSETTQKPETWKLDWMTPEDPAQRPRGLPMSEGFNAAEGVQAIHEKIQEESNVSHPVACETCARAVSRRDHGRAECIRLAADMINKVSSSETRQQQAALLNSNVDMAALRRGFAAAMNVLIPAPEPVCKTYWSLLCSLNVAPWRRLFTLERVARQLMRLDEVKKRVPGLSCWGIICDAIVVLSLYFAYAVHPPPGLCSRPGSPPHSAPAAASRTLTRVDRRPGRTPGGCCRTWPFQGGWRSQTLPPKYSCESVRSQSYATGPGNIPRKEDAFSFAAEHSVSDDALVANEQLMHDFFRDAAICTRLFADCLGADSAEQPPFSNARSKESICRHLASMPNDATQIVVDHPPPEGDIHGMISPPGTGYVKILRILVSCIRTARESCGFLLPCRSLSPVWQQETKCTTHDCFREESRLQHVQGKILTLGGRPRSKSCFVKRGADVVRSNLEPPDGVSAALQPLESKCCRVVRMLEFLELALPERIYQLCARRMREEYYHVCDRHYARQRSQHLQTLQLQLFENAHDLTEAELALIKQNLLREQQALGVDNMLECAVEDSNSACACSM